MSERTPETQDDSKTLLADGEAGLWLSESLILALIEANVLDTETILEAIEIVIAAKRAKVGVGRNSGIAQAAAAQLASISASIAAARTTTAPMAAKRGRRGRRKNST